MEGLQAVAGGAVSLHNFSARLWEQLVHFHVMRLTDSLFLWVGATPHLRNLAVALCSRYVSTGPGWGYWEGGAGREERMARDPVGCAVPRRPGQGGVAGAGYGCWREPKSARLVPAGETAVWVPIGVRAWPSGVLGLGGPWKFPERFL